MIKAVIFDVNGVLMDSMECYIVAYRKAFASVGIKIKDEEFLSRVRFKTREIVAQILKEHKSDASVAKVAGLADKFVNDNIVEMSVLRPHAAETLKRLEKGFKVAIATTTRRSVWNKLERRFGLHAELVMTADDIDELSIKPGLFLKTATVLGVKPTEAAVVEDSPTNIEQVQAFGMKAVGIAGTHPKSRLKHADWVVGGLSEITAAMLRA